MRWRAWIGLAFSLVLAGRAAAAAPAGGDSAPSTASPPAAEFRDGQWMPVGAATAPARHAEPVDPTILQAQSMLASGQVRQFKPAYWLLVDWVHNHPKKAAHRDLVIFLLAQAKFDLDDRISAFYYCDELMDEYPESSYFGLALNLQYTIADDFLNGHKMRFLGLPILSAYDEAVEMMYRIQQRAPGSPLAEKALLRTADYYYASRDYDLAHDAYARYVKDYPRSPRVPAVRLREAFASLAQFRGVRFDPTPIIDARAQLQDIITAYPDLAREEDLPSLVRGIDDTLTEKIMVTADFYRRTHAPGAAAYLYRYLLATYPNAPQVPAARVALTQLPAWALAEPQVAAQPAAPLGPPAPGRVQ